MKKKIFLASLALATGLTLASCGGGQNVPTKNTGSTPTNPSTQTTPATTTNKTYDPVVINGGGAVSNIAVSATGRVDIFLNYKNTSGITLKAGTKFVNRKNPIDGKNYGAGDLLPAWKALQDKIGVSLYNASNYNEGKDDNAVRDALDGDFKSRTDSNQNIDLLYNSTANINQWGSENLVKDLKPYITEGKMPNFKKYLEAHPEIEKEITYNGKIFFTPYMDGYNAVERTLVMDTHAVELLLDTPLPAGIGELTSGHGSTNTKTLGEAKFTPFINAEYNYPDAVTTVKFDNGTVAQDFQIKRTTNIIKQQNELLAQGTTGKALINQFKAYLDVAFEGQIGQGKTFEKYSEIFTSRKAVYNTDELIALMRIYKANPDLMYYDLYENVAEATTKYEEVQGLFPRGVDKSRIQNLLAFGSEVFGVQGMAGEKENLYFDAQGFMHDAATTIASYDMLEQMHKLYEEGLILKDFYSAPTGGNKLYVNRYFSHTDANSGFGLLMHDYTATQTVSNDLVNGLGTDPDNRVGDFEGYSVQGVKPILAPLTYWPTGSEWKYTDSLTSRAGKTLQRYYEENRAIKNTSWCIPAISDNVDAALTIMDFMFSKDGEILNNFGPDTYWDKTTVLGEEWPMLKTAILEDYSDFGGDIWDYFRGFLGTTQGVGHYRPSALDYQSTNYYAQSGYNDIAHAVRTGAQVVATCVSNSYTWSSSVPVSCYPSFTKDQQNVFKELTQFWSQSCNDTANGWQIIVRDGITPTGIVVTDNSSYNLTFDQLKNKFHDKNINYLYAMANSVDKNGDCVPDEALED